MFKHGFTFSLHFYTLMFFLLARSISLSANSEVVNDIRWWFCGLFPLQVVYRIICTVLLEGFEALFCHSERLSSDNRPSCLFFVQVVFCIRVMPVRPFLVAGTCCVIWKVKRVTDVSMVKMNGRRNNGFYVLTMGIVFPFHVLCLHLQLLVLFHNS